MTAKIAIYVDKADLELQQRLKEVFPNAQAPKVAQAAAGVEFIVMLVEIGMATLEVIRMWRERNSSSKSYIMIEGRKFLLTADDVVRIKESILQASAGGMQG